MAKISKAIEADEIVTAEKPKRGRRKKTPVEIATVALRDIMSAIDLEETIEPAAKEMICDALEGIIGLLEALEIEAVKSADALPGVFAALADYEPAQPRKVSLW